ncbi:MAG: sulfite exporter TauE/SafE family protein [Candidatus Omnitrophica bacterium]|nr:sulfite exporter TauE/SafE family protein [Candidatus Omnitrophota bacterium]
MNLPDCAAFLGWAFVAEVIGTMAGFGAATVLTPIASWFFDIKTAVAVVACFHLFGNASRLWFFGRFADWTIVRRFGAVAILSSLVGAQAAAILPSSAVRVLLGGFLVVYAMLELAGVMELRVAPTSGTLLGGGLISGLIAGLIGTGGAIRSLCLLSFDLPKEAYLGTSALIALVVDATRLPVYLAEGLVPLRLLPVVGALIVVAFGGAWTGQRFVRRIPARQFKRLVAVMLLLMGLKLAMDGLRGWPLTRSPGARIVAEAVG